MMFDESYCRYLSLTGQVAFNARNFSRFPCSLVLRPLFLTLIILDFHDVRQF